MCKKTMRAGAAVPHSPLPWSVRRFDVDDIPPCDGLFGSIETADGWSAAVIWNDVSELPAHGNAAFIVRAVNHHDALLAALKAVIASPGCCDGDCCPAAKAQTAALADARAAVAAAEGRQP